MKRYMVVDMRIRNKDDGSIEVLAIAYKRIGVDARTKTWELGMVSPIHELDNNEYVFVLRDSAAMEIFKRSIATLWGVKKGNGRFLILSSLCESMGRPADLLSACDSFGIVYRENLCEEVLISKFCQGDEPILKKCFSWHMFNVHLKRTVDSMYMLFKKLSEMKRQ